MEISNHPVHELEFIPRLDKQGSFAGLGVQSARGITAGFQDTGGGGSHGNYPVSGFFSRIKSGGSTRGKGEKFPVKDTGLDLLRSGRFEGA